MNKLLAAFKRNIYYWFEKPLVAHLEVTYRCNLSCKFCAISSERPANEQKELTTQEWEKVITGLKKMGVEEIVLVGAEPLIRKDIFELIEQIKKLQMGCLLITNGMLLGEKESAALVKLSMDKISISIDGPPEIHDTVRGVPGTFDVAIQGIKNVIAARANMGKHVPQVEIHATICKFNFKAILNIANIAREVSADTLSLQYLSEPQKKAVESSRLGAEIIASSQFVCQGATLLLNEEEVRQMREQCLAIVKQRIGGVSAKILIALSSSLLCRGFFPVKKCYMVCTHIHINPYGEVFPCAMLKKNILGNARIDGIKSIWEGEELKTIRAMLRKKFFPVCRYCCHFNANLTFLQAVKVFLGDKLV